MIKSRTKIHNIQILNPSTRWGNEGERHEKETS